MYRIKLLLSAIVILVVQVQYTYSACSHDSHGNSRVGSSCEYTCHCKNDSEQCDDVTGLCNSGCANGWMGPGCQYRDLAFRKKCYHIDSKSQNTRAQRANDDDRTTCSETAMPFSVKAKARTTKPWWRLWMADYTFIQGLVITTESGAEHYFYGFKVYVEESTNQHDNTGYEKQHICYKHDHVKATSTTMHVTCKKPMFGNQIRIELASKMFQLILCDVKIFEGRNLAYRKAANQISEYKTSTGACLAVDGDMSTTACSKTKLEYQPWWSVNLAQMYKVHAIKIQYKYNNAKILHYTLVYSENDKNWTIVRDNNNVSTSTTDFHRVSITARQLMLYNKKLSFKTTLEVCEFQVFGDCPPHRCGLDCTENCNCKKLKGRISGKCYTRCNKKWTGVYGNCNIACDDGRNGKECAHNCSGHCKDGAVCQKNNGICQNGCAPGWQGLRCKFACSEGTYGENCNAKCGQCFKRPCDNVDGACASGCKAGYKDTSTCVEECDPGTYGKDCAERCNVHCLNTTACRTTDDQCGGCKAGWKGDECKQECGEGEWGGNCTNACGSCYDDIRCDKINGACSNGCKPGYKNTTFCTEECDPGTYGKDCAERCNANCLNTTACRTTDGHCDGCQAGYKGDTCEQEIPVSPAVLAAAVCVGVAAILVIAGVLFAIRRKRRNQQRIVETFELDRTSLDGPTELVEENPINRNDTCINSADDYQQQSTTRSGTNKPTSTANPRKSHTDTPIQRNLPKQVVWLTNLTEYIRSNIFHRDHLTKEFNTLPYGLEHPTTVALKPTNISKNRYIDMYAYDHSRVVLRTLPGQPDSDYINASFINGHKKKNAYIAAQAPTIDNIDEFWRMIWEKEVSKVIMVTNLIEEGKVKCLQYWNCEEPSSYGDISVTVASEDVFAEFIIRAFIVKSISTKQRRKVMHFHFTVWPDKSTPKKRTSLVQFWSKVRKDDVESFHPWLVHCSAGVGRTGTFIALDILYGQGKELKYEQYKYLHEVVFEALFVHVQAIPIQDFENEYSNLLQVEKTTGNTGLMSGFKRIQGDIFDLSNEDLTDIKEACSDRNDVFAAARRAENRNKNRYNNILASNKYRPFLSSHVPGCNDYINAVYVPSNRNLRGYILSQTPLENTAVDCCRLLSEYKIQTIVTFDDRGVETVGTYLPDNGSLKVGPFEVELTSEERRDDYNIRNFKMEFKEEGQWCIMQIVFTKWSSDDTVPRDHNAMLNLINEVEEQLKLVNGKCILVQCLNGADRSGLFVVLMNVLERMRIEQEVAIPQVIRQMRQIRQQILPTYEQYKFCHKVVLRHLQKTSPCICKP